MTLQMFDLFWSLALIVVSGVSVYATIRYRRNLKVVAFWYLVVSAFWFVDSGVGFAQGSTVMPWVGTVLGSLFGGLAIFNYQMYRAQVERESE